MNDQVKPLDQSISARPLADFVEYLEKRESIAKKKIALRDDEAKEKGEASLARYVGALGAHDDLRDVETARELLEAYQQYIEISKNSEQS